MLILGALGGALYALIPAICRVYFGASEILTSLMLVYVADFGMDYLVRGPWRDPHGLNFPTTAAFDPVATVPTLFEGAGRLHAGSVIALVVVMLVTVLLGRTIMGFEIRLVGAAPKAARFSGFSADRLVLFTFAVSGALAGLAGIIEVAGPIGHLDPGVSSGYGFTAIIVAFLGPAQSGRHSDRRPVPRADLHRRRRRANLAEGAARSHQGVPGHPAVLRAGLQFADRLPHPPASARCESLPMLLLEAIILSVISAATPLLLASSGELVVERSGVLNLGIEGMMIVGAACGFAGAYLSGSMVVGALCGILAGAALSAVFGILTLGLAVNQVAAGLALTILGVGLSGLIGAGFVGQKIVAGAASSPAVSDRYADSSAASCSARTRSSISRSR